MAHRHKHHKASGGRTVYTGAGSNVAEEAMAGGDGGHKRGGKAVGKAPGHKGKHRFKRGGSVGSDRHPFSSAHRG